MQKRITAGFLLSILLIATIFYFFTDKKEVVDKNNENLTDVVAEVGGEIITVNDLRLNYEFGYPNLKTGSTTKERLQSYLSFMINEKLMAIEGGKLGLRNSENIKNLEQKLLNELRVEALIKEEVKSKIVVTQEEIKEAMNKSKVSFKFRFWAEDNLSHANETYTEMKEKGFADVVDLIIKANPEFNIEPKNFETNYLTWLEISPDVLNAIKDLPAGEISKPVKINDAYFLFQVLDIKRSAITENEYKEKASSVENTLFHLKLQNELMNYVSKMMEPVNLTTKGKQFRLLADAIAEWKRGKEFNGKSFLETYNLVNEQNPSFIKLKQSENDTIVKFTGGCFSVKSFIEMFDVSNIKADPKNKNQFRTLINDRIAMTMRDYFMAKKAGELNLDTLTWVNDEIKNWRNKWVYRELADKYVGSSKKELSQDYKNKISRQIIYEKIDSLKSIYPVKIYQAVLDTMNVTDFKKSRWASLQLYKAGTGKQAFPVVDPVWTN